MAIIGRAAAYLAVFVVTALLDLVVATAWVRPDLVAVVGTLLWALAGALMYGLGYCLRADTRPVPLAIAWLLSPFLMFMLATTFWYTVLHERGERIVAVVNEVHDSAKGATTYSLVHRGHRIPGRLTSWPGAGELLTDHSGGRIGDHVTIVRDPAGLVDPRRPEELEQFAGASIVAGFLIAVLAGLCLAATWTRPRDRAAGRARAARIRRARG